MNRIVIQRTIEQSFAGHGIRIDEWMERLRKEVQLARESDPTLEPYHLHDLRFQFDGRGVIVHMDFRL